MIIEKSTATAKVAKFFDRDQIGSSLRVVGVITTPILIEQPTVEFPLEGPTQAEIADDANWQQDTTQAIMWQMDADNLRLVIDGSFGWVRFNKTGTDDVGLALVN